jgi:hypothetical protein
LVNGRSDDGMNYQMTCQWLALDLTSWDIGSYGMLSEYRRLGLQYSISEGYMCDIYLGSQY